VSGPNYFDKERRPKRPNYLGRDTRVDWRAHEKRTEKRSGDRRQPGSGNQPGKPADVRGQGWLRENKASKSGAEGMYVQGSWLQKIVAQAMALNLNPAIELSFDGQAAPVPTDWTLVPSMEFEALRERAGDRLEDAEDGE
jgi:hypothetical protein